MSAAEKAPYEKKAADAKKAFEQALEEFKAQGGVAGSRRMPKRPLSRPWRSSKHRGEWPVAGERKRPTQRRTSWTSGQRSAPGKRETQISRKGLKPPFGFGWVRTALLWRKRRAQGQVRQWESLAARGGRVWTRSSRLPSKSRPLRRKRSTTKRSKNTKRRRA